MIRHVVAFKLKEFKTPEERLKAIHFLKTELMLLPVKIKVIRSFEVGIDVFHGPASYDLIINSTFDSMDDLKIYREHPDHQAFVSLNKEYTINRVMVDYDF